MRARLLLLTAGGLVAVLLALAAVRWWSVAPLRDPFTHAPCATPVHYTVGEVDGRFGFDALAVTTALVEAANLWQAASRTLLFIESDHPRAMQVNLQFDERQHAANTRRSLRRGLDYDRQELEAGEALLLQWGERIEAARREHEQAGMELARRVQQHEREVAAWNAAGGRHAGAERRAIEAERAALRGELDALERRGLELNADIAAYNRRASDLRERAAEFQSRVARFNRTVSAAPVESGRYSYDHSDGRRIDVFRVESHDELVWVLAHELGHALGIGHVADPGAIMHATLHDDHERRPGRGRPVMLADADLEALAAVCGARLR